MGGIDVRAASVGSTALNSFINSPSNQPGVWDKGVKSAAPQSPKNDPAADAALMGSTGALCGVGMALSTTGAGLLLCLPFLLTIASCSSSGNDNITPPKQQPTLDGGVPVNPDSAPLMPDLSPGLDAGPLDLGGIDAGAGLEGGQNDLMTGGDALAEIDLQAPASDTDIPEVVKTEVTIAYDAGIMAEAAAPDSAPDLLIDIEAGPGTETGRAIDGLAAPPLPPGFGPNSCPDYASPEDKQLVLWPKLDSINDVPINASPPNTDFFKPHPALINQARQGLSSLWDVLAVAGNEHWFDGIQRKGLMLYDIPFFYEPTRQSLGLSAYPFSPFVPDNYVLGYPLSAGFGELGTACNLGVHEFYRLLHAPYEYRRVLAHEFVHWFGWQWQSGAPGVDVSNSIDFTPKNPSIASNDYCYSGTFWGESSYAEENRADYVSLALFFPSARSIMAEADQALGCDASITSFREDMYKQIYKYYFNGLTPPAESVSIQNWERVYLLNMRGLPAKARETAKAYVEANPSDADGIKSIFYTLAGYEFPRESQALSDVPYQGGAYSGVLHPLNFSADYTSFLDKIVNNPATPAGVPYPEEIIRYALWYKTMIQAYPKYMISIYPDNNWVGLPVFSEDGLSAAQSTLGVLTARIGKEDHPLVAEAGLMNALLGYWRTNKPLMTSTGIQYPDAGYDAGAPAAALAKMGDSLLPPYLPVTEQQMYSRQLKY